MQKIKKNNFLFIIGISIITLILLIVGAIFLYEDNSKIFSGDGYIISTTTKKNAKYYFSANTKYKKNVDEDIIFKDNQSNDVTVDPASFIHYLDGSVGYLQRGALVNLNEINSSLINYYNVNNENLITHKNGKYSFSTNGVNVDVNAFVGRISDDKYIIAGEDLYLQVPNKNDRIKGEYFEILFIEDGIVKIDNQEASYQVTAQDSYVYVGNNIIINLGNNKIYYENEAKMLLSQITINGDENIDLDIIENNGSGGGGGGSGSGSGDGEGTGEGEGSGGGGSGEGEGTGEGSGGGGSGEGEGTGEGSGGGGSGEGEGTGEGSGGGGSGEGEGTGEGSGGGGSGEGEGSGSGSGSGSGDGEGEGSGSGSGGGTVVTDSSAKIELIKAEVTSTVIDLSLQLNNAGAIKTALRANITNVNNGEKVYEQDIPLVNGTFYIRKESLSPNTDYALTIFEVGSETEKRYFQKTFKTKELGIILEKYFATSNSLAYNIIFNENTEVSKARIKIYDSNGSNESIRYNEYTISANDMSKVVEFTDLKSNSSYSVMIDAIWIDNAAYSDVYNINRIDNTLKTTPQLSEIDVTTNSEEIKFNIKLHKIKDPDEAIISYTYNFYLADEITSENQNPEPIHSITKNDADALELILGEGNELKAGVDYRCKIVAQYYDNEMIREVSTDYSKNFLIKSRPNISFEASSVSVSQINGKITLIDANCTVPINGRTCFNGNNTFTLRYYKSGEDETSENDKIINFDGSSLISPIAIENLSSNTTYIFKVYGNYYDDEGNIHKNVQLGDSFYVKTDESETLKLKIIGNNLSGYDQNGEKDSATVVTFNAALVSPQDEEHKVESENISSITLNLYNGSYNKPENLIGNYIIKNKEEIADFFSNYTITNKLFTNKKIGPLNTLQQMITVTNNSTKTLNGTYTVEVANVLYPDGRTKYKVEDSIYTFKLTPEYYLDSRIESNLDYNYINITKLKKEDLTEEQYEELSKDIPNLDELNDDTYVGVKFANSLSDEFVNSAFTYENVTVKYIIRNLVNNKIVKEITVDMDNKYQPTEQIIYLDPTPAKDKDKGEKFTRGYNYEFKYELEFETEDGRDPVYTNYKLSTSLIQGKVDNSLFRQSPIYSLYVSESTEDSITYRYKISDIDNALSNKKLSYIIGSENVKDVENELEIDNKWHDIKIPINTRDTYSICFNEKKSDGTSYCKTISENIFESEYNYDDSNSYTIIDDFDNTLKIKLKNNDITNRAVAYKVTISDADDDSNLKPRTRYFLASQLFNEEIDTGQVDEEGNPILETIKYIAIDYASISEYMKHNLKVTVDCYYDSGLIGINNTFPNGLILENKVKNSTNINYLNIYNSGSSVTSTDNVESAINGIYMIREEKGQDKGYKKDDTNIHIFNNLQDSNPNLKESDSKKYNPLVGATYYDTKEVDSHIGINYELTFTNEGINFGNKGIFNPKVLKVANLKTNNNSSYSSYRFESIIPRVSLDTSGSTINSISLKVESTGVYSKFLKDDKFYLEVYSDSTLTNKINILESKIIEGEAQTVTFENLVPDTTYYVAIYGYIDGKYTRLYDADSKKTYVHKTYEAKTLGASGVLKRIDFSVNPYSYNYDDTNKIAYPSNKKLEWKLKFNSTKNFKIRFELYDKEGNQVNFDGSAITSCNKDASGTSSNGYISNCYIQVDRNKIDDINESTEFNAYTFSGDNFVFGDDYYELIIYAIPYTNGRYDYNNELQLYKKSLKNTDASSDGIDYKITIPTLTEAKFEMEKFSSSCDNTGCNIKFVPKITDLGKVIKGGKYSLTLMLENNIVETKKMDAKSINEEVIFSGLSPATNYEIEFSYEANINNNGYTEEQKNYMAQVLNEITTAVESDIVLGEVTAKAEGNQKIILNYHNSINLSAKIVKIGYTVRLLGESSNASGTIDLTDGNNSFQGVAGNNLKLTLDLSQSGLTLKTGNSYNIYIDYYYKNEQGILTKLGGKSFTTKLII